MWHWIFRSDDEPVYVRLAPSTTQNGSRYMRVHTGKVPLVRACLIVVALFLIVILPLAHAEAASTKGMGGGQTSSQSGDGKSGRNKTSPSGGSGINKMTPRSQPGPSSSGNTGNSRQGAAPPAAKRPDRPRTRTPKPDRGPNKFSPRTTAPQTQTKNSSERNRSSRKKRERREEQQRRNAPAAYGAAPRYEPSSPRRDDDEAPTRPLNGPGAHGIDGEDDDHDGIVDNERCDVVCPLSPVPPLIGGGFPGIRPPAAPPRQAPTPPKSPTPRTTRPTSPREQPNSDEYRDRGDGRDPQGRYSRGNDGRSGKDAEKRELDKLEDEFGTPIIRDQRRASVEGRKQSRYYDGLIPNGDGTYSGIEIKSGGAGKTPQQKQFDARVSPETPATVTLPDGTTVKITNVIDRP